ncbi:MAG TPA: SDR family oxidoreductase [Candidatus Omnitrophota bacterium]|nr:SDR family oxidoreductase [Candidatus Omnitrophota bacterium]
MMKRKLFITGSTGVLGRDLVRQILADTDDEVVLLARSSHKHTAEERVHKLLDSKVKPEHLSRVRIVEGDVTLPNLGLSEPLIQSLTKEVDDFYHIAALTALNGSEEDCMKINFYGTEQALHIARIWRFKGKLEKFVYFSTAYVAGSLKKCHSRENSLPTSPGHANFYESSKYRSETKVREAMSEGLPVIIIRPSIVVGDSKTGEVSDFNVIYPFFKLFAHGVISKLVGRRHHRFNIVPIDFVIHGTMALVKNPANIGKTFHLVAKDPPTIGMLLDLKDEVYPKVPKIELVDPDDFDPDCLKPDEKYVFDMLRPYLGYSNDLLTFDTTETEKALQGTGVKFPVTDAEFLRTLIGYAVKVGYLVVN